VVICTRDRADTLRRCLAAVQMLDYPDFEVIVVDNASVTDATRDLVQSLPGVRYVREDRPGLDWARNRGIAEARHDIIAYTDDDTQVDDQWLRGLAAAFAEPGVDAVTGLVVPMKLDTVARMYFEDVYGGMGRGFTPWFRPGGSATTRDKLWSSGCGVGANMAYRRSVFDKVGRFDPALDVGTATRGGGDIEMFHRVMARGAGLAYAPEAIVWHEHRADFPALLRQLRDNGSGFAAYLMAAWRNRTVPRRAIAAFALKEWIWGWQIKRLLRPGRHRRETVFAELGGMMQSRRFYNKALVEAARLAETAPPEPLQVGAA
jgi:glycosyltransferase involved in cell wall biosynthesis